MAKSLTVLSIIHQKTVYLSQVYERGWGLVKSSQEAVVLTVIQSQTMGASRIVFSHNYAW